jgi:putative ABC transport system permease protein
MRNPLNRRILRELKQDIGKYIVIFVLLVISIGFVSGFIVAGSSMLKAYNGSFEKYTIENGHFRTGDRLLDTEIKAIEKKKVRVKELFYIEQPLDNGTNIRIYDQRDEVDLVCVMKGRLAQKPGEIAIDRMYAVNNGLEIGDVLGYDGGQYEIVGLVALSDYSALFYNNNDMMFDSSAFGVGVVSKNQFALYEDRDIAYNYAFLYDEAPSGEEEEKQLSDDLMEYIADKTDLISFVPRYLNQAITFTGEDVESDKAMMEVFLYIVMIITAFVFAVTISNTIQKEAGVIGTLRATGYTIGELLRHYMMTPFIVTAISAVIGNILGYTVFKEVCVAMYYNSYSLPTYETIWSLEALIKTTLIPVAIMMLITFVILRDKLSLSPLKLIRRDLGRKKQKSALKLSPGIRFFDRFRIRVLIQNTGGYVILVSGLFFANILLFFGMMLPPLMHHYQDTIKDTMLARYTYIIQIPVDAIDGDDMVSALFSRVFLQGRIETANRDAEKFTAVSLKSLGEDGTRAEEIVLYGIDENSRYIDYDFDEKTVLVSSAYADKFGIEKGRVITLKEPYEDKYYGFKVTGVYPYDGAVCVFMSKKHLGDVMGYDDEMFSGYFSDTEITDIESKYLGTIIDEESLTRVSRQLLISMGDLMLLIDGFSMILFMFLIYLLSKIIIEKNAQSVSMAKILGYSGREIAKLYILPTAIVVVVSLLLSYPLISWLMVRIFKVMLRQMMSGWLIIWLDPSVYFKMFGMGVATYAVVAVIEYRRIRKIPMDEALKNVE